MSVQALVSELRLRVERLAAAPACVSNRRLAEAAGISEKSVRNFRAQANVGVDLVDRIERAVTKLEPAVKVPSYHAAEVDSKRESMAA